MNLSRYPILSAPIARCALFVAVALGFSVGFAKESPPDTTPEGLVRVAKSEAALVYVRPGVDFSKYDQVILVEPRIAFRANWKSDTNASQPTHRVSDADMAKMIETGKQLLLESFAEELKKGGYKFANALGPKVLAVSPAVWDLDVYAPDPDGLADVWGKTYTDGAGEAALEIKLYDGATGQLLLQAIDQRGGGNDNRHSWSIGRSQRTNKLDASYAFSAWARMLVDGLNRSKAAGTAAPAAK